MKFKRLNNIIKKVNFLLLLLFQKQFLSFSEDDFKAKQFCGNLDETKMGCLYALENININLNESNNDITKFFCFP